MNSRSIAIVAACSVVGFTLLDYAIAARLDADTLFWYHGAVRAALLTMVAICTGAAARRFKWWNEYLGRAWSLFCAAYVVLAVSEIVRRASPDSPAQAVLVVVANLALVGAYWLMARALNEAGLEYYGSTTRKVVFFAIAVALAVALCSGALISEVESMRAGDPHFGSMVSVLADAITFLLVAPLLLTTLALWGGQLFWIFAMLTVGTFGWMVNQGASTLLRLGDWVSLVRSGRMFGFALACFFIAGAALAQRAASRSRTPEVSPQ